MENSIRFIKIIILNFPPEQKMDGLEEYEARRLKSTQMIHLYAYEDRHNISEGSSYLILSIRMYSCTKMKRNNTESLFLTMTTL